MGKWSVGFIERRPRLVLPGLLVIYALLIGVVTIAPPVVSMAVAVLTAGAWCRWLEN